MKIYKILPAALACTVISLCVPARTFAQAESPLPKKLIEAGWDRPDTARLRANIAQMEQTPFDGVIIDAVGKDDAGKEVSMRTAFSDTPWKKEWFQNCVDDLKAVHSKKLTDNFIQVYANPGNVDWFDDAGWKQIIDHLRIAAWVAKEGKIKGILFDPEAYNKPHYQFDYRAQPQHDQHTFAEYQAKARQRGREVISAVAAADPNLVFFTFFMNSINAASIQSNDPQRALQTYNYSLYPAFINGWLDAAPPSMIFVEGSESQGYRGNDPLDFLQAADLVRNTSLSLVAPENRQKYLAQVQMSFGLYLDAYVNPPTSTWYIDPKGVTPTRRLQINATDAAKSANEYVWIYGEKYRWWPTPFNRVNPESWEDKLPGITDALLGVTHPDLMLEQIISTKEKQDESQDLIQNGEFASLKPNTTSTDNAPDDWKSVDAPAGWITWQNKTSQGTFSQDNTVSHTDDGSGSGRIANVLDGCLIQRIDVKPGESYVMQAWNRQEGQGVSWVRIRWMTAEKIWTSTGSDVILFGKKPSDKSTWERIQGKVTVPPGVGKMVILLYSTGQMTAQDIAWFDDMRVYKTE